MSPLPTTKEDLLKWVNDQQQLDPTSKFILYRLAQFADADCCAWSKVETLATAVNVSRRTVQLRIARFEGEGLIRRTGRAHELTPGPKGARVVPIYQLAPLVPGLGAPADSGANSAPQSAIGVQESDHSGAAGFTPNELNRTEVRADALTVCERARSAGFDEALAAYPQTGLAVTDFPRARQAWLSVTAEVAPDVLLAAIADYVARDRALAKGDYGAPAFEKWLLSERWRAWLPADVRGAAAGAVAPAKAAGPRFPGPSDLRDDFLDSFGEGATANYLDPCRWDGERRVLLARTGVAAAWFGSTAWWWLSKHELRVERFNQTANAGVGG